MFVVKPMQSARARIEGFISRLFKRTAAIETRVLSWSKKRRAFRETEQNASIEFCTKCFPDAMRPRMASSFAANRVCETIGHGSRHVEAQSGSEGCRNDFGIASGAVLCRHSIFCCALSLYLDASSHGHVDRQR